MQGGSSSNVTLNVRDSTNANAKMISLFGDYGFKFEGRIRYGRVHRMRRKRQGYVEYKKPLLYTDQYLPEVNIVFATYDEVRRDNIRLFVRSNETYVEVSADCVVSNLNLQYCSETNTLKPHVEELKMTEGCLSKQPKIHEKVTIDNDSVMLKRMEATWQNSTVKTIINPLRIENDDAEDKGKRRSTRSRTVISHLFS